MASSINASTAGAGGVITTADNSGVLNLQSGGVTVATINSTGIVMASNTAPAFSASRNSSQSVSTSTATKIQFSTEAFDTNSNYDNATNYRFTPTVAGYYQINLSCRISYVGGEVYVVLYKNGSEYLRGNNFNATISAASIQPTLSVIISMNGSTDYLEGYIFQNSGSSQDITGFSNLNNFSGFLARSA